MVALKRISNGFVLIATTRTVNNGYNTRSDQWVAKSILTRLLSFTKPQTAITFSFDSLIRPPPSMFTLSAVLLFVVPPLPRFVYYRGHYIRFPDRGARWLTKSLDDDDDDATRGSRVSKSRAFAWLRAQTARRAWRGRVDRELVNSRLTDNVSDFPRVYGIGISCSSRWSCLSMCVDFSAAEQWIVLSRWNYFQWIFLFDRTNDPWQMIGMKFVKYKC